MLEDLRSGVKIRSDSSATEDAYERLKALILHYAIRPGERTSLLELAAKLGVGRTPVREAVNRLESEGLLVITDRSGTRVLNPTIDDVKAIFDLRRLYEESIAEDAARLITTATLETLRLHLDEMDATSSMRPRTLHSRGRFTDVHLAFHRSIVEAGGNRFLTQHYVTLQNHLQLALFYCPEDLEMSRERHAEHLGIYRALVERDGARLRTRCLSHARSSENIVIDALRTHV